MNSIFYEIIDLLKTDVVDQREIRSIHYGDPGKIPKSSLPAIVVYPDNGNLKALSNCSDKVELNIVIKVVFDLRDYIDSDPETVNFVDGMMDILMERDNNTVRGDTIVGTLRKYLTLNNEVLYSDNFNFDFGYGDEDVRSFPTVETMLTTTAQLRITRPT